MERFKNETDYEYEERLIVGKFEKTLDLDWCEIQQLVGDTTNTDNYRKESKGVYKSYCNKNKVSKKDKVEQLAMETTLLRDENNRRADLLRKESRMNRQCEIIEQSVRELNKTKPLIKIVNNYPHTYDFTKTGVIQLSDWHYSLNVSNFANQYNTDIFMNRASEVCSRVRDNILEEEVSELVVLIQGDLISSSIHQTLRVQNQVDVITQIIDTSETVAEMINEWQQIVPVRIAIVIDNHSRVSANKKESIEEENYMRLTEWFLKTRFSGFSNVTFIESNFGLSICDFEVQGKSCVCVHGHEDKPDTIVQKISTFTRQSYDFLFTAHNHHIFCEEVNECVVIANGSLIGTDGYSKSLRMSSKPCQIFTVINRYGQKICPIYVE